MGAEESEPLWVEQEVEIRGSMGPRMVPALTHPNAPGLAITMHHFGLFGVTHLGSGFATGQGYERAGHAGVALARLAKCIDWTGNQDETVARLKNSQSEPVPFEGCTVTSGGVTRPMTKGEYFRDLKLVRFTSEFPWEEASPWDTADALLGSLPSPPTTAAQDKAE